MSRKPDFDSLEDWADRKLKQLGSPAAPKDFLSGVLKKVHEQPVAYVTPDNNARFMVWLRWWVVLASACLLIVGFCADASWFQLWWNQSWLGNAYSIALHLMLGLKQVAMTFIRLVPQYIWIALGVSVIMGYVMVALTGTLMLQYTMHRRRVAVL